MLRIVSSNRQETLLDALAERLRVPADANPLCPERVIAERGMDTWILQQLAERHGIAANIELQLPGVFIWQTLRMLVPESPPQSQFDAAPLTWRLLRTLPPLLTQPAFQVLAGYLRDDPDGRKLYQLCGRIAAAFDDYLVYRPDMVLGWEAGRLATDAADEVWQAALWRALVPAVAAGHRAHLLRRFAALSDAEVAAVPGLPARISVFGVPALPPVYGEALARLARTRHVDLYMLNPSAEFWGDLVDPKRLPADPDALAYAHDLPNRLLASWGQPVRIFLSELYGHSAEYVDAWDAPGAPASLLQRVQADIRELRETEARVLDPDDDSLRIASAWGPGREVEALHDWLLDRFQREPSLKPREVAIYLPDVEAYAPHVEAVFGAALGTPRYLPWNLADRPARSAYPLLAAVQALLHLPESRLTASEVLGLLETPAVARRFDLDETALAALRDALVAVHAHWGLDTAMRQAVVGGPAPPGGGEAAAHTWDFALRRLFLGLAMASRDTPVHGVVPAPLFEGQAAAALGGLQAFLDGLAHWRGALAVPRSPTAWVATVHRLLEELLEPAGPEDEQALEELTLALADWDRETARGGFSDPLGLPVFRDDLLARLDRPRERGRLYDGRITIAALTPMRSVPFRIIAVLGLDGEAFPRSHPAPGFDLVARSPRPGDRSRRLDDRHLFLETLLSARDALYLGYTGRNPRDGSESPPSVVVSELLDYLVRMHGGETRRPEVLRQLFVEHPLQPFSRHYFEPAAVGAAPALYTYDADWVAPARAARREHDGQPPFCDTPLSVPATRAEVTLEALIRFLRHPTAFFLRERLGIVCRDEDAALSDDEPFTLDGLATYRLKSEWLERRLAGGEPERQRTLVRARGDLPEGRFGDLAWAALADAVEPLAAQLGPLLAGARPVSVDLLAGGRRIGGTLRSVTAAGLVHYSVATAKPRHLLGAWVEHLALLATAPAGVLPQTRVIARDGSWSLGAVADPAGLLAGLLSLYEAGAREPLPFFPGASWEWQVHAADPDKARVKANAVWQPREFPALPGVRAESEDPANRIAWGHREDPFAPRFEALAAAIYGPLQAALRVAEPA